MARILGTKQGIVLLDFDGIVSEAFGVILVVAVASFTGKEYRTET
jgi:hypothetical protein